MTSIAFVFKQRSTLTGPRRLRMQPHQVVQVGRTEWADFAVSDDPHMSPVHFRLCADNETCRLEDLGSDRGTLVNGRPVDKCVLSHGDLITAGSTQFEVLVERPDGPPAPGGNLGVPARQGAALPPGFQYERVVTQSGVEILRGRTRGRAPTELIRLVGKRFPVQMLLDLARAGLPLTDECGVWPDLLARLPESLRGGRSIRSVPLVASTTALLDKAWGKDALICLLTKEGSDPQRAVWESLGAFSRPLFLRQQLLRPGRLATLLAAIPAVLLETGDDGWELYRNPKLMPNWHDAGLTSL